MDRPVTPDHNRQLIRLIAHRVRWALIACAVAIFMVIVGTAVGFFVIGGVAEDANEAVTTAEAEREARSQSIEDIISQNCNTNNEQDRILAGLLETATAGGGTFGSNIDPRLLTPFQLQLIQNINRIQALSRQGPPSPLERAFEETAKNLRHATPCEQVVALYLAGKPIPSTREFDRQFR